MYPRRPTNEHLSIFLLEAVPASLSGHGVACNGLCRSWGLYRHPVPMQKFDTVIDVVAGEVWPVLIRALKPGGHYAVSGVIAGLIVEADLREIYLTDITIHGCSFKSREVFSGLVDLMIEGRVKPSIAKTYPLRDIVQSQEDFQSKKERAN
jgi:NADPH:quinone reductase-like Zn-dependent oxidoreductase